LCLLDRGVGRGGRPCCGFGFGFGVVVVVDVLCNVLCARSVLWDGAGASGVVVEVEGSMVMV
jgi:hypothetical protein